ncbi:hypothetical protein EB241_11015 [Erwinia psidii]|uniref:Uncharacterized protein n=1 Tax=Erwinia psidii TaxID=69224 RepID=A0A3N6SKT1_9GAMM|nr:hypothetical protein EB241_11015 [Erwinia psidii]
MSAGQGSHLLAAKIAGIRGAPPDGLTCVSEWAIRSVSLMRSTVSGLDAGIGRYSPRFRDCKSYRVAVTCIWSGLIQLTLTPSYDFSGTPTQLCLLKCTT